MREGRHQRVAGRCGLRGQRVDDAGDARAAAAESGAAGRGADRATPARCAIGRCAAAGRRRRAARRACRSTKLWTSSSGAVDERRIRAALLEHVASSAVSICAASAAAARRRGERARPGEAAGHVVFEQTAIEAEGRAELERRRRRAPCRSGRTRGCHRVPGDTRLLMRAIGRCFGGIICVRFEALVKRRRAPAVARDDENRVVAGDRARPPRAAARGRWPRPAAAPGRAPVRMTTSCCTRSTRRRNSAAARSSAVERRLAGSSRRRPARWYAPSPARFTRPSSAMSREIVACVASKPRWRSRRRSCSWLWSASRSTSSRMTAWRRAFMDVVNDMNYTSIFIDLISTRRVYNYSFSMHTVVQRRTRQPGATRPAAARRHAAARRRRRRHRLHRPGTAAPAGAPSRPSRSPRPCRRARRGARGALPALARLWNGTIVPLDARRRCARGRRRVPRAARHGRRRARARAGRRRRPRHRPLRRVPPARRRARARAGIRKRTAARRASPTASPSASAAPSRGARLVANPGCYPTATLLALAPLVDGRPARCPAPTSSSTPSRACRAPARRRPSGRTFRRCTAAWRPTACSATGTARKSSRALGGDGHVHAAPGAARPRHPGDHLRARARRAPPKRRSATSSSARTAARRSSASSARRCPRSSTSRTRTSATSAGGWTRRAARSWCR